MEAKQKKTIRRVKKDAGSPAPCGPTGGCSEEMSSTCGHHGCTGGRCNVRYVGPVTSIRDHHIMHAARGAANVWTAAIVAGLAVVLTGAIAYTALGADTNTSGGSMYDEFRQINLRLDKLEALIQSMMSKCSIGAQQCTQAQPTTTDECTLSCKKAYPDDQVKINTCLAEKCGVAQQTPSADQCIQSCKVTYKDNQDGINSCLKEKCGIINELPAGGNQNTTLGGSSTSSSLGATTSSQNTTSQTGSSSTGLGTTAPPNTTYQVTATQCLQACVKDFNECYKATGNREQCMTGTGYKDATGAQHPSYSACRTKCASGK